MKTKIGLISGLALVMFIGVFTTMLALGFLNPQRAGAQSNDPKLSSLTVTEQAITAPFVLSTEALELSRPFSPTVTVYTAAVRAPLTHVTVDWEKETEADTVAITPADAVSGTGVAAGHQVLLGDDPVPVRITVTGASGSTPREYELDISKAEPNTDRRLSGLKLSGVTLVPAFDRDTFRYTGSVGVDVGVTTVTPKKSHSSAQITFRNAADAEDSDDDATGIPGHQENLATGANTITVKVTAENASSRNYVIVVTRLSAGNDPSLDSLAMTGLDDGDAISPSFASGTLEYTATVPFETRMTTVTISTKQDFSSPDLMGPAADPAVGDHVHVSLSPATAADIARAAANNEEVPTSTLLTAVAVQGNAKGFTISDILLETPGGKHTISIALKHGSGETTYKLEITRDVIEVTPQVQDLEVTNTPTDPGARSQIQVQFETRSELRAGLDTITLDFDSSFGIPERISKNNVNIAATSVSDPAGTLGPSPNQTIPLAADPVHRLLPGQEGRATYTVTVPDMDARSESGVENILAGATVTLTFSTGAGFTNPTESNVAVRNAAGARTSGGDDIAVYTSRQRTPAKEYISTAVQLFLNDAADNRDTALTVTGKGFKNGTTATVFLDRDDDGQRDVGEVILAQPIVESDDTFETTFTVTVPPFLPGSNNINAIDGESPPNVATTSVSFEVEGLLTVSSASVSPGDTLTLSLLDWPNEQITRVELGGLELTPSPRPTVANNSLQFDVIVPNVPGTQQVRVSSATESDTANITVAVSQ